MAILITIITLSILSIATIQFYRNISSSYQYSYLQGERLQLLLAAKSGLNIGRFLIFQKENLSAADTSQSDWYKANNTEYNELFSHITLTISIMDGEAKLPINFLANTRGTPEAQKKAKLYREALHRILISDKFGLKNDESRALVDALSDWIDSNDTTFENGAENDYYQALETPYSARNKPITELKELLPVKGMSHKLLFGDQETEEALANYITPNNPDGLININTVHPDVLIYLFPQLTNILIEKIVKFRKNPDNTSELNSPEWYKKIVDWPQDITLPKHILTVKSAGFTICAEAKTKIRSLKITANVARTKDGDVQLLSRRINE